MSQADRFGNKDAEIRARTKYKQHNYSDFSTFITMSPLMMTTSLSYYIMKIDVFFLNFWAQS